MYEEGTLRPPTAADMDRRELPLEHIIIAHSIMCHGPDDPRDRVFGAFEYECRWERHIGSSRHLNVADLIALCRDYGIPYEAAIVSNGYEGELALDWSHLLQCADCDGWYRPGDVEAHRAGGFHAAVMLSRSLPPPVLTPEQMRTLGRVSPVMHTA